VGEEAQVTRNACVGGRAHIMGQAVLGEGTVVEGFATVGGSAFCVDCYITDDAQVLEEVEIFNAQLRDRCVVAGKTIARHINASGHAQVLGNNSLDYVEMQGIIRVQDCKLRYVALRQRATLSNCQLFGANEVSAIELGGGVVVQNARLEGKLQAYDQAALDLALGASPRVSGATFTS
jgi:NDP-sugar pyrophosphorylase family protein